MTALRKRGILVGVLSNTLWPRAHHQEVFARDGLDGHIDAAVYSSELPVAKPHREAFQAILDALGVTAGEAVFVGDRMWDDVHGAKELGMRAIWIPHSKIPAEQSIETASAPDAVAYSLADVLGIVERWQGA
jgi:putative hydrolase of the HAD superfamily